MLHTRALFSDPSLGVEWHRLDLGTTRLGVAVSSPDASEPWDHFLRVAGAERAAIELMADVPQSLSFEHADPIFEGLTMLRPRLLTNILDGGIRIRGKLPLVRAWIRESVCHIGEIS